MEAMQFAVIDVETTGGYAVGNRVTEVGIAISNGKEITNTYHTLINPQTAVPRHITALTGIDDDMLVNAPTFEEKAEEIETMLADAVFVAHNVNFDFSFIRQEFGRIGTNFRSKKLCTARYARGLLKDQDGFSLAKLAKRFNITNDQPHRALSDAITAAEILHRLIEIDQEDLILKKISRLEKEVKLPLYLPPEKYHSIPNVPGIYKMYGKAGKPIYIGKAKELKKRISQHFMESEKARTQAFMKEVVKLETLPMGTELMALLQEDAQIRAHWPKYNRAQKQINMAFHVVHYKDQSGIGRLGLTRARNQQDAIISFQSKRAAQLWLHQKVRSYELHPALSGLTLGWQEFELPAKEEHNQRLMELLNEMEVPEEDLIVRLKGRASREKGFIWLAKGTVYALGFAPLEIKWNDKEQLSAHATMVYPSSTMNQLVGNYLIKQEATDIITVE